MRYFGTFKDRLDDDISVVIETPEEGNDIEIGESHYADIQFAKDPVTISCNMDSTMDVIIFHTAEITLLTRSYLADSLFTGNDRDITVVISKDGQTLFSGFVEPNAFSQPYDHEWNQLQISCTDLLSTLQYQPYRNIKDLATWALWRKDADSITILDIIQLIFSKIAKIRNLKVLYDGSVKLYSYSDVLSVFDISIFEGLFLGDEYDDLKQSDEVLEMVL